MDFEKKTGKNAVIKIICVFMAMLMIFSSFGMSAFADDDKDDILAEGFCGNEDDNPKYTFYNGGKLVIDGTGEMKDYNKENPFFKNFNFEVLVVEPGVTSIGKYAFYNCDSLWCVELAAVTSVSPDAFEDCDNISLFAVGSKELDVSSVALPEDVIYYCFKNSETHKFAESNGKNYVLIDGEGDDNLVSGKSDNISWTLDKQTGVLTVSSSVSLPEINDGGFPWDAYKVYIKEIIFEEGITDITADYTAYPDLEAITVPESVKAMGASVLEGNGKLKKLTVLNPECVIAKNDNTKITAVIYGYDNSTAKAFAEKNELTFEMLECLHKKTTNTEKKEPTCKEVGHTEGVLCITCKTYISGYEEIETVEHTWADATCTDAKTCSVCKATEGEALGHKWMAATCTEAKTCSECKATEGKALGHKEVTVKGKKATCTEKGITDGKKCTECGVVTLEQKDIPASGHKWTDASCTVPKTCSECKITSGSKLDHDWQTETCTEPRTCSMCKKTEGKALGHIWTEATCAQAKTCSRCKLTEGEPLPHTEEILPRKAATCTETGLTEGKKCSVCGYVINVQRETPAFGHIDIEVQGKVATCTEKGYTAGKICSLCGEITEGHKEISALGHKWIDADCSKARTCSVCSFTEGKAAGHKIVNISGKKPTCTEKGLTAGKKCSVCGVFTENQLVIAELGHEEVVTPGKEPTCTENGYTESAKCSVCGAETEAATVLDAYGHEWQEATCKAPKTCTVCKLKEGKKSDHNIVTVPAVAATYKSSGKTAGKKCEYCDKVTVKQKTVARKKLKKVTGLKVKSYTSSSVTLTWKKTTGAESYKVYYSTDGKKWKSVKVKKNKATVKKLDPGKKYQFKVRAFAGKYYGAASKIVKKTTKVKKPVLSAVKSSAKNQATVSWKKVTRASGYVLEYSTSKTFSKKTTKTIKFNNGKTTKTTIKNLKSGKKYYVRVKAYKTVNKKEVYGSYSSVKSVKVK